MKILFLLIIILSILPTTFLTISGTSPLDIYCSSVYTIHQNLWLVDGHVGWVWSWEDQYCKSSNEIIIEAFEYGTKKYISGIQYSCSWNENIESNFKLVEAKSIFGGHTKYEPNTIHENGTCIGLKPTGIDLL